MRRLSISRTGEGLLIRGISESFGGCEARRLASLDVNFFASLRVSPLSGSSRSKLKRTKSYQSDLLSSNNILEQIDFLV